MELAETALLPGRSEHHPIEPVGPAGTLCQPLVLPGGGLLEHLLHPRQQGVGRGQLRCPAADVLPRGLACPGRPGLRRREQSGQVPPAGGRRAGGGFPVGRLGHRHRLVGRQLLLRQRVEAEHLAQFRIDLLAVRVGLLVRGGTDHGSQAAKAVGIDLQPHRRPQLVEDAQGVAGREKGQVAEQVVLAALGQVVAEHRRELCPAAQELPADELGGHLLLGDGRTELVAGGEHGVEQDLPVVLGQGVFGELLELEDEKGVPGVPQLDHPGVVLLVDRGRRRRLGPGWQIDLGEDVQLHAFGLYGRLLGPHGGKEALPHGLLAGAEHGQQARLHVLHRWGQVDGDPVQVAVHVVLDQVPQQINGLDLSAGCVEHHRVDGLEAELPLAVDARPLPKHHRPLPGERGDAGAHHRRAPLDRHPGLEAQVPPVHAHPG